LPEKGKIWFKSNIKAIVLRVIGTTVVAQRQQGAAPILCTQPLGSGCEPMQHCGMDVISAGGRVTLTLEPEPAFWVGGRQRASKNGGRYWDRTSDPHDVNVVLYR
jgi:hypothetical protein